MKIGIIREGKIPHDRRVCLTPAQCRYINDHFAGVGTVVQPSSFRCFPDEEYVAAGIRMQEDLSECDLLMGIKEVPVEELIRGKTYFFFSHTIKKQPHNRKMLQEIIRKGITLTDYEIMTDHNGMRIIGFGRFAGLVGTYNGFRAYGIRHGCFLLKPVHHCKDVEEMHKQIGSVAIPPLKIAVTGGGRVAGGVTGLLDGMGIRRLTTEEYLLSGKNDTPVYVQLDPGDYNQHKEGKTFDLGHFFRNPHEYEGNFRRFLPHTDMLIGAAYWDPSAPVLFNHDDVRSPGFRISVIADISCDIDGSIPTTKRPSTIDEPFYDFNRLTGNIELPFTGRNNITVMAVDNLPCGLPRDSSADFGRNLINVVLPLILKGDPGGILDRATITRSGQLTPRYKYLEDFAAGKE